MAYLFTSGKFQAFSSSGAPLSGGKVYTYAAGTTTPLATYTTQAGTVANANPVVLDSAGRADIWLLGRAYRIIVKTSTGATVYDTDNLRVPDDLFYVSVADYGAVGDGVTNDTTAIDNAIAAAIADGKPLIFPVGTYLYSGTTYAVEAQSRVLNRSYPTSVNETSLAQNNCWNIVFATPNTTPQVTADTRQGIAITGTARGAQHGVPVRATLQNYSTDGNGNAGVYSKASSDTGAQWTASVHSETRHGGGTSICLNAEAACYSTAGSFYGIVVLNSTNGAETTHPLTGASKASHPSATGIYVVGTNSTDPMGAWVTGLQFTTGSMRASGVTIEIDATAAVEAHIKTSTAAAAANADILLQGNSSNGIILNGTYTNAALRIATGQYLSLTTTGTQKILAGSGSPESAVTAVVGSLYVRTNGGAGTTLYVKESGSGDTGWVAK